MSIEAPIKLEIARIRRDGGTQPRAEINDDVVLEYYEAMNNGDVFPPVTVFHDGSAYWLADGFHRVSAAELAEQPEVAAEVRSGTRRDAVLFSVGANSNHGLRRSNADKRRSVETLLRDEEWAKWSNYAIADKCAVAESYVRKIKHEIGFTTHNAQLEQSIYINKHGTTATMNTGGIGKRAEATAALEPPAAKPENFVAVVHEVEQPEDTGEREVVVDYIEQPTDGKGAVVHTRSVPIEQVKRPKREYPVYLIDHSGPEPASAEEAYLREFEDDLVFQLFNKHCSLGLETWRGVVAFLRQRHLRQFERWEVRRKPTEDEDGE